ncbi:unnamed protein product [Symbiodinium natans]|uniref:Ubiquitin-like domain-containing protein n=1 Tax=Symbiodinium natans TaxID=878477 RepID=A0A812JDB3_9DINO|nr:unnamed protein product [Symbiodinium natans]
MSKKSPEEFLNYVEEETTSESESDPEMDMLTQMLATQDFFSTVAGSSTDDLKTVLGQITQKCEFYKEKMKVVDKTIKERALADSKMLTAERAKAKKMQDKKDKKDLRETVVSLRITYGDHTINLSVPLGYTVGMLRDAIGQAFNLTKKKTRKLHLQFGATTMSTRPRKTLATFHIHENANIIVSDPQDNNDDDDEGEQ